MHPRIHESMHSGIPCQSMHESMHACIYASTHLTQQELDPCALMYHASMRPCTHASYTPCSYASKLPCTCVLCVHAFMHLCTMHPMNQESKLQVPSFGLQSLASLASVYLQQLKIKNASGMRWHAVLPKVPALQALHAPACSPRRTC